MTQSSPPGAAGAPRPPARHFVFVLLDRFTLLPVAGALDALRLANRQLGFAAYRWSLAGAAGAGAQVTSSAGVALSLEAGLKPLGRDDTAFICGGIEVAAALTPELIGWLRRSARNGARLGALCTGAQALAQAGLLDGHRATVHWEHHAGLAEAFPAIDLTRSVYVIDGPRLTAAGGTASIDLMLALIAADHGQALANAVADQQIAATMRSEADSQRLPVPARIGLRHPKLARAVQAMETNLEEPVSPARIAADVGLSTRQLERLFRHYLARSPKRYYMELRLGRARNLLQQTELSVINVGLASGFASPSHFARCYRARYGTTPYRDRAGATLPDHDRDAAAPADPPSAPAAPVPHSAGPGR